MASPEALLTLPVALLIGVQSLLAQDIRVTGTVNDASGAPVVGATVVVAGTQRGTTTLANGSYVINAPANGTLHFTYVGMTPVEIAINNRTTINVVMASDATQIDNVMVVAYGTTTKESFTGSAEVVKSSDIIKRNTSSVTKALEGSVACVMSTAGSGQPGADAQIRIRGIGSMASSNSPLYVVDGVPYDGYISSINPNDIESMSVLKDAAASSLYGARASNGVVILTLKKGTKVRRHIYFKANAVISQRGLPRSETVNTQQYMEIAYAQFCSNFINSLA